MKKILLLSLLCIGSYLGAAQDAINLHTAIRFKNKARMFAILNSNPAVICMQNFSHPLLPPSVLVSTGDLSIIEMLIMRGADVDEQEDYKGRSPLRLLVEYGDDSVFIEGCDWLKHAELLMRHKASVDIQDDDGLTPLHYAKRSGRVDFCRFLLEHKASVNIPNVSGETPLTAGYNDHFSVPQEARKKINEMLAQAAKEQTNK